MTLSTRLRLSIVIGGLMLGYAVSSIGFADYRELNRMFTFQDFRMFLSFAFGLGIAMAGFALLRARGHRYATAHMHKGIVPGGLMFGAGWALSGGCPGVQVVQLGSGSLATLVTLAGTVVGMLVFRKVNGRWFTVDRGSCGI